MARPIDEVVSDLANISRVSEDNFEAFEALVHEASEDHNREAIGPLIDCLDDSCEFDEIMFGVIHTLESFSWDDYFGVLSERLPAILSRSPRWGSILVTRIMNSEGAYGDFLARLSQENEATKSEAIELMRRLSTKERFQSQCEAGIRVLSQ